MSSPYLLAIHGRLVIVGYEPDGDSCVSSPTILRCSPACSAGTKYVARRATAACSCGWRRSTRRNCTTAAAQPDGDTARDWLMQRLGFRDITYRPGSTTVTSASPDSVRAVIYSKASDPNGRPISYLHVGGGRLPQNGSWTHVTTAVLDRTVNAHAMGAGVAYPTFYSSTPESHATHLRELAAEARQEKAGVWAVDQTALFQLVDQDSIGPHGQLILPKLFRRATDYLKDVATGFHGNLSDWLRANNAGSRQENDMVVLPGGVEVCLAALLEQRNSFVAFGPDLLDIVFVEK